MPQVWFVGLSVPVRAKNRIDGSARFGQCAPNIHQTQEARVSVGSSLHRLVHHRLDGLHPRPGDGIHQRSIPVHLRGAGRHGRATSGARVFGLYARSGGATAADISRERLQPESGLKGAAVVRWACSKVPLDTCGVAVGVQVAERYDSHKSRRRCARRRVEEKGKEEEENPNNAPAPGTWAWPAQTPPPRPARAHPRPL